MVAINIEKLTKHFAAPRGKAETAAAVDDVSLHVASGALFFLLGPSGCGKTTLLRMIAGFTAPTRGRILFGGTDISATPPYQRDTGMVFQSYALWPHMTIADNVAFGLDSRGIKNPDRAQRIKEALALVQLQDLADRRPNQLSGGQQQRVALARALAIRPKCLLLDEPLSNLDAKLRLEMRSEIRRIVKESGTTAIYVTHDQKEALAMADGIALMNAGRLEQTGTPADLYRHPRTRFSAGFIGETNFLSATLDGIHGSTVLLKTASGPVIAARTKELNAALASGKPIVIAFRPEAASLSNNSPSANLNRLSGHIVQSTYLGESVEHRVRIEAGEIKVVELNPKSAPPATGTPAVVHLPAEQVMVVEA